MSQEPGTKTPNPSPAEQIMLRTLDDRDFAPRVISADAKLLISDPASSNTVAVVRAIFSRYIALTDGLTYGDAHKGFERLTTNLREWLVSHKDDNLLRAIALEQAVLSAENHRRVLIASDEIGIVFPEDATKLWRQSRMPIATLKQPSLIELAKICGADGFYHTPPDHETDKVDACVRLMPPLFADCRWSWIVHLTKAARIGETPRLSHEIVREFLRHESTTAGKPFADLPMGTFIGAICAVISGPAPTGIEDAEEAWRYLENLTELTKRAFAYLSTASIDDRFDSLMALCLSHPNRPWIIAGFAKCASLLDSGRTSESWKAFANNSTLLTCVVALMAAKKAERGDAAFVAKAEKAKNASFELKIDRVFEHLSAESQAEFLNQASVLGLTSENYHREFQDATKAAMQANPDAFRNSLKHLIIAGNVCLTLILDYLECVEPNAHGREVLQGWLTEVSDVSRCYGIFGANIGSTLDLEDMLKTVTKYGLSLGNLIGLRYADSAYNLRNYVPREVDFTPANLSAILTEGKEPRRTAF